MAVMAWRRERFELFSKDALIVFLLLAVAISATASTGQKSQSDSLPDETRFYHWKHR
jgi:hypothetical protein